MDTPEIRLKCWELAMTMAGAHRHDTEAVDKIATEIYDFVATDGISSTSAESRGTSDTTETPVRRGPGRPRKS